MHLSMSEHQGEVLGQLWKVPSIIGFFESNDDTMNDCYWANIKQLRTTMDNKFEHMKESSLKV